VSLSPLSSSPSLLFLSFPLPLEVDPSISHCLPHSTLPTKAPVQPTPAIVWSNGTKADLSRASLDSLPYPFPFPLLGISESLNVKLGSAENTKGVKLLTNEPSGEAPPFVSLPLLLLLRSHPRRDADFIFRALRSRVNRRDLSLELGDGAGSLLFDGTMWSILIKILGRWTVAFLLSPLLPCYLLPALFRFSLYLLYTITAVCLCHFICPRALQYPRICLRRA